MKKILIFMCCMLAGKLATAQKDSLAVDDHGKYIYYKVVNTGIAADVLYTRADGFLKGAYGQAILKPLSRDAKTMQLTGEANTMVAKTGSLAKHYDGRVTCKLNIEMKDTKYRYWVTDFVYIPYKLDRYSNYVPEIGLDVPIEQANKKLSAPDADHYLDQCAIFAKQLGKKLELYMKQDVQLIKKDTVAKKVISINKW